MHLLNAPANRIGGTSPWERNIISGNTSTGINTFYLDPTGVQIVGNFIGTDVTGTTRIPNTRAGIEFNTGSGHRVGGPTAGERNLLSGNAGLGITVQGSSGQTEIIGNWIGLDRNGGALSNSGVAFASRHQQRHPRQPHLRQSPRH